MSSKDNETPPADKETGASDSPKKPARTIELEAEEVKPEEAVSEEEPANGDADSSEASGEAGDVSEGQGDKAGPWAGKSAKTPLPPQRTRPSDLRSFVTHLAAGLVGGLIGVVGAGIGLDKLPLAGITGNVSGADKMAQVEERLDEIATSVDEQRKKFSALPGAAPIEDLKTRLAAIEQKPASEAGVPPEIIDRLATLEKTLTTLEQAGGATDANGIEQAAALVARVDGMETALEKRYAALEDQIADSKSEISKAASASSDDGGPGTAALEAVARRLDSLEQQVTKIAARPAPVPAVSDGRAAGLALAFQALRRSAESGGPFAEQLNSVKVLAGDSVDLDGLLAMAGRGAATQATLLSDLPNILKSARLAASRSGDATLLERLASNAQAVVRVRKIGPLGGNDTAAILSRMEGNAGKGDIKGVVSEAGQLEGDAATSVAPWLERAKARLALDVALTRLETGLLANLGAARTDKE